MIKTKCVTILFLLSLNFAAACKDAARVEIEKSNAPARAAEEPAAKKLEVKPEETSGYMSMSDWEKAKTQLSVIESIIQVEMDHFTHSYSKVIEARRWDQFDAALDHAKSLEPSVIAVERAVDRIAAVDNYPEIDKLKEHLSAMIPLLRSFSVKLIKSVGLAKSGDFTAEAALVTEYCADYSKAMEHFRKVFEIYGEILTRGARTDSQKLTGAKNGGPDVEKKFRETEKEIAAQFGSIIAKELPPVESFAAQKKFDESDKQALAVYTSIQNLVMRLNALEPGNEKTLWDAKLLLTTSMSYRMMALYKYREYLAQMKTDDSQSVQTKKIYDVLKTAAEEEWRKYRRQRMQ